MPSLVRTNLIFVYQAEWPTRGFCLWLCKTSSGCDCNLDLNSAYSRSNTWSNWCKVEQISDLLHFFTFLVSRFGFDQLGKSIKLVGAICWRWLTCDRCRQRMITLKSGPNGANCSRSAGMIQWDSPSRRGLVIANLSRWVWEVICHSKLHLHFWVGFVWGVSFWALLSASSSTIDRKTRSSTSRLTSNGGV